MVKTSRDTARIIQLATRLHSMCLNGYYSIEVPLMRLARISKDLEEMCGLGEQNIEKLTPQDRLAIKTLLDRLIPEIERFDLLPTHHLPAVIALRNALE